MFTIKEARKTFRHPLGVLWVQRQTTALKWLLQRSESHELLCFPVSVIVYVYLHCSLLSVQ